MCKAAQVITAIEQPLFLAGADSTLGQVAGRLSGHGGVVIERGGEFFAVLAAGAAGYPASRLVDDLPLVKVPALAASAPLTEALALVEKFSAPGLVVLHEGRPGGWVSREQLVTALLERAQVLENELREANAHLEERVRLRTFQIEVLYEMAQKLGSALNYDDLFGQVALGLRPVVDHDLIMTIVVSDGINEIISYPRRRVAEGVLARMEQLLVDEFSRRAGREIDPGALERHHGHRPWQQEDERLVEKLESVIISPLYALPERLLVGLILVGAEPPDAFSPAQQKLIETVLQQAAVSVQRLRALVAAQQRRLENLIEHLPDGVALLAGSGRVLVHNGRAAQYLALAAGWQPSQPVERLGRIALGEALEKMKQAPVEISAGEGEDARMFECRVFPVASQDGEERHLRVLVIRDVTREREIEMQAAAQQRLVAIGQLAGGVAHDFNNLLTVILTSAGFLAEDLRADDPLHEDVEQIRQAGQRAVSLTRQLLAFSRKQVLKPQLIDLNQILVELEKMLRRLIGENIDLSFRQEANLPPVMADPGQLEQVIVNLAVNARDAMPEGGMLTLETGTVELDDDYAARHPGVRAGSYVMLAVSDTGIGMDRATRARIFEPFFTTKERGKGTGLGLSTVYGIIKQSGGNIWVYSEPGRGTTFKIYLPRAEDEEQIMGPAGSEKAPAMGGSETILLAEDEEPVRRLSTRLLKRAGYNVLEARDGLEALTLAEYHRGKIDLLLTDVVMPGPSGKILAEELVVKRPGVKVVYMSGYTDNAIVHHGVLQEGVTFIQKPFTAEELLQTIRRVLDEK